MAYGQGLTLVVHANKSAQGAVRISNLRKKIAESDCPFDSVLLLGAVSYNKEENTAVMHLREMYPQSGLAQVNLNMSDGTYTIEHNTLETLSSMISN